MSNFEEKFNAAQNLYKQGDEINAAEILEEIIDAKPLFAPAYNILAEILYKFNNKEKALELYKKCIEIVPNEPMGYIGISNILYDLNEYEEALGNLEQANLKKHQENKDILLTKAKILIALKDFKTAKNLLKKLPEEPQSNDSQIYYAQILLNEGNEREALNICSDVLDKDPQNYLAYITKAMIFTYIENYEEALNAYRKAINIESGNPDIIIELAKILFKLNKPNEALENLILSIEESNESTDIIVKVILLMYEEGFVEEAFKILKDTYDKNPDNSKINIAVGCLLLREEDDDLIKICDYFKQAILNNDLNKRDFVIIHDQILYMLSKNNYEIVKDIIYFWHSINPFDTIVLHLKNIIDEAKINSCEIAYLKEIYDFRASQYDKNQLFEENIKTYNVIVELLSKINLTNKNSCAILDAGCGYGTLGEMLSSISSYNNLCGVDFSRKMIEVSNNLNVYGNLYNVDIGKYLENTYDYFDLIIADGIFQTRSDIINVLKMFTKSLILGGHLIFTIKTHNSKEIAKLNYDGLFSHSVSYLNKLIRDFDVELIADKSFSYRNYYDHFVNSRCFVLRKTFL